MVAILEKVPVRTAAWAQTARLVERAQDGDREAFGQLVEQFQRTVYAVCLNRLGHPSEAAELTQEVFLHVMKRIGQLREPERFAGWLRQVAARMAINRATRKLPPTPIEDEVLQSVAGRRDDPHEALVQRERAARLWEALEQLRPIDREVLVAFYIDGQTLIEMADNLDVPIGTVKRRLHTARRRLKEALQEGPGDADEWTDGLAEDPEELEVEALGVA